MPYTNYNWIRDGLAIGGLVSEPEELPFDAILSMETGAPIVLRELVTSGRIDYQWRSIIDGYCWEEHDEIIRRFDEAAEQLQEWLTGGKRVLVHCVAGVSRSVTAVVWYLMRYEGMSWDEALQLIRAARPQANPNIRFEIPMRMAGGEDITRDWIANRIEEYCRHLGTIYDVEMDRQEVWKDLERQGTLGRIGVALS